MLKNVRTGSSTLAGFILAEQRHFPTATGDLSLILEQIAFAAKIISWEVNKAGIANIVGATHSSNVHGETQQKLDVFANTKMITALDHLGLLCGMASEEAEGIIPIPDKYPKGKYIIVFDPLDGSSNIDVNVNIGTIFAMFKKPSGTVGEAVPQDFLQCGRSLVAAGYIVYGSSTMLVYTTGRGVNGFTLDPSVGEFILSHPDMTIPETGHIYSVNEANFSKWDSITQAYVEELKNNTETPYIARYIGSLVADFHRNLLKGGVFLYPADTKNPKGKLRLMYEAIPLAYICEQAGGRAIDGKRDILDIIPDAIHQRTPLIIGSKRDVERYLQITEDNRAEKKKGSKKT
ncbi:MAG: class 1 fructose-bisphosphatase [Deferribacteraceae bacterium]|jgi:fructose-1,6-bisphosphatase I|nr:class 1 fructose-bisphosphatase [Deferribacteraceae bacterium]